MLQLKRTLYSLENPWDMAFTNGGDVFTEKCRSFHQHADGNVTALYGMKGSKGYKSSGKDLFCEGQAGMLGVALSKDFDSDRTLFLYSASNKYHGSGCKTNFEKCDGNIVMKFKVAKTTRAFLREPILLKTFSTSHSVKPAIWWSVRTTVEEFVWVGGYLWVGTGDRHGEFALRTIQCFTETY